ncbi:MAG: carboxyl transferase [Ruminococcus sp.]|nr:carboxyl transferase [Ruminococcus sp.]
MSFSNVSQLREELNKTSAYEILSKFFDEGSFCETDALLKSEGNFAEAVTGYGTVMGVPVYAFAQNSDVNSGAMSKAQAKKIARLYELAKTTGAPVVGFYDSVGGMLTQKDDLLYAYGEILSKASTVSGVVPQLSVVLGTALGTTALTAASADFIIMSEGAELSIEVAPKSADASFNAKKGIANIVCEDKDSAIEKARDLITYFPSNNLDTAPVDDACAPKADAECEICSIADADSLCFINEEFTDIATTAFGRLNGEVVGFVSTNGDVVDCKAGQKISKFVRFCDAFSIPVLTVVDAKGFSSLKSASKVTNAYAEATTAKIALVKGTAVGPVYIALAGQASGTDVVFALENAVISPINPKALAFIMNADEMKVPVEEQDKVADEFAKKEFSAINAAQNGYVDDIVSSENLRVKVAQALEMLSSKRVETLPKKHSTI